MQRIRLLHTLLPFATRPLRAGCERRRRERRFEPLALSQSSTTSALAIVAAAARGEPSVRPSSRCTTLSRVFGLRRH